MTAIKITKFLGTAPKNASELLPDTAAQVARNSKLYSGDLIPYPSAVIIDNADRTGAIKTLYGLRDPDTDDLKWLSWLTDVSIATPATDALEEQRFYYTGDGVPKVSTYALATAGAPPYPTSAYDLGLPLPTAQPTTVATEFDVVPIISFARDGSNNVTIVTGSAHNLKSGATATISGFSYRTGTYGRSTNKITVTIVNHGLSSGAEVFLEFTSGGATSNNYVVTVTGTDTFTCIDTASGTIATSNTCRWDIRDLNITTEVTVVDDTTIKYFSPGPEVATTTSYKSATYTRSGTTVTLDTDSSHNLTTGDLVYIDFTSGGVTEDGVYSITYISSEEFQVTTVSSGTTSGNAQVSILGGELGLGGQVQARSYVYTWYTPWEEESVGSDPSEELFIKEGQLVTVSDLPTAAPAGDNFIRGIRLYRTLAGPGVANYYRLRTLWFPNTVSEVERTSNVSTVTFLYPHNLVADDRFKISGCSEASFNITGGIVTDVVDQYTMSYAQVAANVAATSASGTLYYDVSEDPPDDPARYWGDGGNYDFVDDFNFRSLFNPLRSDNYDPPPEDLQGLIVFQNSIMAGFVGNTLYFSEPGQFHAWPPNYARTFEYAIVGIIPTGADLLVLTEGYPYLVSGSDPAVLAQARLSSRYPCLNRNSIVEASFGVVWATHDGLAVFSRSIGAQLLTRLIHSSDTWNAALDPSTIVGVTYKDTYIASHATAGLVFENDQKSGPSFIDIDFAFTAAWYDVSDNKLYLVAGANGDIYIWDDLAQPSSTVVWKSKTLKTTNFVNIGAARLIADYIPGLGSSVWETVNTNWEDTEEMWDTPDPLTFRLYVDKTLLFTTTRADSTVFRLPTGYKSDTFEVEVEGILRVRAIHLGETPTSLRQV